jgi:hypothetical protein
MSPPTSLKLLGYGLLAFAPLYCTVLAYRLNVFGDDRMGSFSFGDLIAVPLVFAPFPTGTGLLRGKKWAWWAFLVYAAILIIHESVGLLLEPGALRLSGLGLLVAGLVAVIYVSRQDLSAPYFKMYPRGWRLQMRKPVVISVQIGDQEFTSTDLSVAGLYAMLPDPEFELNQAVPVRFRIGADAFELTAGVARIDEDGVGFAFRRLKSGERKRLSAGIREFQERTED